MGRPNDLLFTLGMFEYQIPASMPFGWVIPLPMRVQNSVTTQNICMAERGRSPGFKMPEEHRVKIQNSNILNALIEHVSGEREMSATQVTAGLGLLKKALPDLAAVQISGDPDQPVKMVIEWQNKGS
jgi:hypothetical protein